MVGAGLDDESSWAGISVDRHHPHPATVRGAVRARRADRLMLVTDAMPSVGSDAATFELQGRTIRREGDILRGAAGLLAGSTLTMAGAVANMIAQGRVSLRTAVTMASEIGRAPGRERVCQYGYIRVVAVSLNKKKT